VEEIEDRIPEGFIFIQENNPLWTYNAATHRAYTKSLNNTLLGPGDSASAEIVLIVGPYAEPGILRNYAEIFRHSDENHSSITDVNSTPGNRVQGEDDEDFADVILNEKITQEVDVNVEHWYYDNVPGDYVLGQRDRIKLPEGVYVIDELKEELATQGSDLNWEFIPDGAGESTIELEAGYVYTFKIFYSRRNTVNVIPTGSGDTGGGTGGGGTGGGGGGTDGNGGGGGTDDTGGGNGDNGGNGDTEGTGDNGDTEGNGGNGDTESNEDFPDIDFSASQPDPYTPGGTNPGAPPVPNSSDFRLVPQFDENGNVCFIEIDDNGVPLGEWHWDDEEVMWIYDEYPPLSDLPVQTGVGDIRIYRALLLLSLMGMIAALRRRASYNTKHQE